MYVVFSLLFFFFKQKTAYEMRISDCSSDVCSSDLWTERRRKLEAFVPRLGVLHHFERDFDLIEPEFLAIVEDDIAAQRAEQRHQIGRESCRERECQYEEV